MTDKNVTRATGIAERDPDFYNRTVVKTMDYAGIPGKSAASLKNDLKFWLRSEQIWIDAHWFWFGQDPKRSSGGQRQKTEHLEHVDSAILRARQHICSIVAEIEEIKERHLEVPA